MTFEESTEMQEQTHSESTHSRRDALNGALLSKSSHNSASTFYKEEPSCFVSHEAFFFQVRSPEGNLIGQETFP